MTLKEAILLLTEPFLNDQVDYSRLFPASRQLKGLFQQLSNGDFQTREARSALFFSNGKATGPFEAAMCLEDIMRTRQFMRGVYLAIGDKLADGKENVHVLYAGTGPFATLMLPALLRYEAASVSYTFVEINPLTVAMLKNVLAALELTEYSIQLLQEDATCLRLDQNKLPDVVVSETMQNNLAKEQQVSVYFNLMRQTPPTTVFIPEVVELYLGMQQAGVGPEDMSYAHFKKCARVFELSRPGLSPYFNLHELPGVLGQSMVTVSPEEQAGHDALMLFTEITVYGNERLLINQSGLTTPTTLREIHQKRPLTFTSRYHISEKPGLLYEVV